MTAASWKTNNRGNLSLKSSAGLAKQLITLSTGAIAFTVTYLDKFTAHGQGPLTSVPKSLYVAWALFGLTVLCSVWTLMAITGTLDAFDRKANHWSLSKAQTKVVAGHTGNVRFPAVLMVVAFLLAIAAMIYTGIVLTSSSV